MLLRIAPLINLAGSDDEKIRLGAARSLAALTYENDVPEQADDRVTTLADIVRIVDNLEEQKQQGGGLPRRNGHRSLPHSKEQADHDVESQELACVV